MKKFLSLLASVVILFTLAFGFSACGNDGKDGANGVSVETAYFDDDGNLIIKLTDGKEINCGKVNAPSGESFYFTEIRENGEVKSYAVRGIGTVSSAEVVIPSTYRGKPVTEIGENAFFKCQYITSVTIPDTVTAIGNYAFEGCEYLKTVDLGNGVKTIGDSAFAFCSSLEKIKIPASVRTIGSSVFCSCFSLGEVVIEEGLERMGISVFTGCNALEEISLPDSILGVFESDEFSMFATFMNCASLKTVKLPANLEFLPQYFFSGCFSLQNVTLGKKLKSVGYAAFYDNYALTSLILPASLESCESYSFYRLDGLETVYFEGTAAQWADIQVRRAEGSGDSDEFSRAARSTIGDLFGDAVTVYFYSESKPSEAGNYWHYSDGVPVKW